MKDFFRSFGIFLFGFVSCIIAIIVVAVLLVMHFSAATRGELKTGSYLLYDFAGTISEKPLPNDTLFDEYTKLSLSAIINGIEEAKFDDKIQGILINGDLVRSSYVQNEEIMEACKDFKKSGKKIYAWLSSGTNNNYFLASIADKIYMPDTDSAELTLTGYSLAMPYYKDLLDKLGVGFNVVHIGKYKGTGENYTRNVMSDELKEQYTKVFDNFYTSKIAELAKNRNISAEKLEKLFADGATVFMTSKEAREAGLIDELKSYEDVVDQLFKGEEPNLVSIYDYTKLVKKGMGGDKIAVIYAAGTISNYYSGSDIYSGDVIGAKTFNNTIETIIKDDSIKGVIIRVNSPGGSALASELMYQEIEKLKKSKKVYVSMGSYAASGGYYISCAADKIVASPYTITGSIGVVSMFFDIGELGNHYGVHFSSIKKNKYDDIYAMYRAPTPDELDIIRHSSLKIYGEFTGHVIENRKIDPASISQIAEGRIWTGAQAVDLKLADQLGTFSDTVALMKKDLNLSNVELEEYPKPLTLFERLRNTTSMKVSISAPFFKDSKELESLLEAYHLYTETGSKPVVYLPYAENLQ